MKPKTLWLLLGVTIVVVAAAFFAARGRGGAEAQEEELLFAELSERVNDVVELHVASGDQEATVRHRDDGWGLVQKDFYPAKVERVKETVLKAADLEILEPKTANPERFDALGLQDPDAEGSEAVLLSLRDEAGEEIAGLVVGDSSYRGGPTVYVRRAGEDQSFECEGRLDVDADPLSWIEREILRLESDRVRSVEIRHADGELVRIEREEKGSRSFVVQDVPAGMEETHEGVGNGVATALSYLRLDDVRPRSEVDFEAEPVATTVFRTYDGLVVSVATARFEEATWAGVEVRYEEPPAPEEEDDEASPEAPIAEDDNGEGPEPTAAAEDGGTDEDEGAADPEAERRDEAKREARKLRRELGPWAYRLPEFKAESLTKRRADLLADVEPEPPSEPGEASAPADDAPGEPAQDDTPGPGDAAGAGGTSGTPDGGDAAETDDAPPEETSGAEGGGGR